jgi:RimJ/RimL family protein N-acetyltransferase
MSARVPLQILTPRLRLEGPDPAEAEVVHAAVRESLAELRLWMPWADQTLEQTRGFLEQAAIDFEARNAFHWNLWLREPADGSPLVGACGFPRLDWRVPAFEIGYWMRSAYTGRGLATEAVDALRRLAQEELGARRIEIRASAGNRASRGVAERCGFALEAVLRSTHRETGGELGDTMVFSIVR